MNWTPSEIGDQFLDIYTRIALYAPLYLGKRVCAATSCTFSQYSANSPWRCKKPHFPAYKGQFWMCTALN